MANFWPCRATLYVGSWDIQIETRNNKLELQSVNNRLLTEELDRLLERLRIPPEVSVHYCSNIHLSMLSSTNWYPQQKFDVCLFIIACSIANRRIFWGGWHATKYWSMRVVAWCYTRAWSNKNGSFLCKNASSMLLLPLVLPPLKNSMLEYSAVT